RAVHFDRTGGERRAPPGRRIPLGSVGRLSNLFQVSAIASWEDQATRHRAGDVAQASDMHTVIVVAVGFGLLVVCALAGRLLGAGDPAIFRTCQAAGRYNRRAALIHNRRASLVRRRAWTGPGSPARLRATSTSGKRRGAARRAWPSADSTRFPAAG